jgi:Domain of unknown function (DUF4956)
MLLNEVIDPSVINVLPMIYDFWARLLINLITTFILVRFIYFPHNGQKELLFTFIIIGLVAFMIASMLNRVKIDFAMAIGMFAVFSIIRYRTPPFEIKEMSYLFAVIGISVINALIDPKVNDWLAFSFANTLLIGVAFFLEKYTPRKNVSKKLLTFTLSELRIINNSEQLAEEIKNQTGLNVFKVEVTKISAAKNEVTAWIYFR